MSEIDQLLARQAAWQEQRRRLSWEEKIGIAEAIRDSVAALRATGPQAPSAVGDEVAEAPPTSRAD